MNTTPWSAEDDANLKRMRSVEHQRWPAIAIALGRSRTACHLRYSKIVPRDGWVKVVPRSMWSDADATKAYNLRYTDKKSYQEIANIMGMTVGQVNSKIDRMLRPSKRLHFEKQTIRFNVPQECIDDRDRRLSAHRDLTAMFFGDPEPGRSALDRRGVPA